MFLYFEVAKFQQRPQSCFKVQMDYVDLLVSLSDHGRGLLQDQGIDEETLGFVTPAELQAIGVRLGDVAKIKKFLGIGPPKRGRDDEPEDFQEADRRSHQLSRDARAHQ